MKKIPLLFAFSLFVSIVSAYSQGTAFIRRDTLLSVLPGYTMHTQTFDSLKTSFSEELKLDQQKLEQKLSNLFGPYSSADNESTEALVARLSPADLSRYGLLQKEFNLIEERSKSYNEILQLHYKEKIQPLLDKLNKAIEEYSQKNKLDMVFVLEDISPALAYVNKGKDITNPIIALLKK